MKQMQAQTFKLTNMKTKVDTYKGFEIYFDTDNSEFIIEGEDSKEVKRSYNACKKYINDFIKENKLFGTFKIIKLPNKRYRGQQDLLEITVVGIHANGNFLCERADGEKFQLAKYNYDDYCLVEHLLKSTYNPKIVKELENQRSILLEQIKEEEKKLPKDISEVMMKVKEENKHLWK